jgi:hypothetical protein
MNDADIEKFIQSICDSCVDAVNQYYKNNMLPLDHIPEYILPSNFFARNSNEDFEIVLEAGGPVLERMGLSLDTSRAIIGQGRVDMVLGHKAADRPELMRPFGFVEFKKWIYDAGDRSRIDALMRICSSAEFGAFVLVKDVDIASPWFEGLRAIVKTSDKIMKVNTEARTMSGQPCCVVVIWWKREASQISA